MSNSRLCLRMNVKLVMHHAPSTTTSPAICSALASTRVVRTPVWGTVGERLSPRMPTVGDGWHKDWCPGVGQRSVAVIGCMGCTLGWQTTSTGYTGTWMWNADGEEVVKV